MLQRHARTKEVVRPKAERRGYIGANRRGCRESSGGEEENAETLPTYVVGLFPGECSPWHVDEHSLIRVPAIDPIDSRGEGCANDFLA